MVEGDRGDGDRRGAGVGRTACGGAGAFCSTFGEGESRQGTGML